MTTTLGMADITPDRIMATVERYDLRLMPGRSLHLNTDGRVVGCCPMGALAIELDPDILCRREGVTEALDHCGLKYSFRLGLTAGFDARLPGVPVEGEQAEYDAGYSLGRATRLAAGLDAAAGGGA